MYAIVKKSYLVPRPAPIKDGKPSTTAGQVKFVRVSPSPTPQEFPDWMAATPIFKAAINEGSIIEVVLKNKPKATNPDLAKARELGFVPANEEEKKEDPDASSKDPVQTQDPVVTDDAGADEDTRTKAQKKADAKADKKAEAKADKKAKG